MAFSFVFYTTTKYIYSYINYGLMKFKAKIWNISSSAVITIPKRYMRDGHFKLGSKYNVEMEHEAFPIIDKEPVEAEEDDHEKLERARLGFVE